jgi:hypothetical protein
LLFILAILGVLFAYILVVKPEAIAVIFFTITIADINVSVEGVPLNLRALIGLALFVRTFLFSENSPPFPSFFTGTTKNIVVFIVYAAFISECYELLTFDFIKTSALTIISAYIGYHFFIKLKNTSLLKLSLYIAGIICFADLAYTYAVYGTFPVQRIYMDLLKIPINYDEDGVIIEGLNHGFYGLVCGMTFLTILTDYLNNNLKHKLLIVLVPVMFLGVLMSTSRSALMAVAGISIFLIGRAFKNRQSSKRAFSLVTIIISAFIISLIVFMSLDTVFNLDTKFIDSIADRLVDEPIAVLNKQLGLSYNVNSLNAMEWRKEASSDAFGAFMDLKFREQLFGIGYWGYAARKLGHNNLPPHNGILMLLIEFGITGLTFWLLLIVTSVKKSLQSNKVISPVLLSIIFIILFSLANNSELTGSTMFLFLSTLIAETIFYSTNTHKNASVVSLRVEM